MSSGPPEPRRRKPPRRAAAAHAQTRPGSRIAALAFFCSTLSSCKHETLKPNPIGSDAATDATCSVANCSDSCPSGTVLWLCTFGSEPGFAGPDDAVRAMATGPDSIWITGHSNCCLLEDAVPPRLDGGVWSGLGQGVDLGGGRTRKFGGGDGFVAALGLDGRHIASWTFGGQFDDYGASIAVDRQNNAFLVGYLERGGRIGGTEFLQEYTNRSEVVILSKEALANADSSLWQRRLWSRWLAHAAATDHDGNVVTIGEFSGTAVIDRSSLTSAGGTDIAVAKFASTGDLIWWRRFGGPKNDGPADLAIDSSGNIYVTGVFRDTISFGGDSLTSSGGSDAFVAVFSPEGGSPIWSRRQGGLFDDRGASIAVDGGARVALCTDIGEGVGMRPALFASVTQRSGDVWTKRLGASAPCHVEMDFGGTATFIVSSTDAVDFGSGRLTGAVSANTVFIANISREGAPVWARALGSKGGDITAAAVSRDGRGAIVVAGGFSGEIAFDSHAAGARWGGEDIWLARIAP